MLKSGIEAKLQVLKQRLIVLKSEINNASEGMNIKKLKHLKAERVSVEANISNFERQLNHLEDIAKNVSLAKEQGLPSKIKLPESMQKVINSSAFT